MAKKKKNSLSLSDSYKRITGEDYTTGKTTSSGSLADSYRTITGEDYKPMKTTTTTKKKKEKKTSGILQKSDAFDDGYQLGDIAKTVFGVATDLQKDVVKGIGGIGEQAFDLASYGVSGALNAVGLKDASKKVKENAMKTQLDDNRINNVLNNINPVYGIANRISGVKDLVKGNYDSAGDAINSAIGDSKSWNKTLDNSHNDSVIGDFGNNTVEGTANYLGMAYLSAHGIPWQLTAGVQSSGGAMTEAYKNGASNEEAIASSLISSLGEIGSEYMFKGAGKLVGTGALDDVVINKLTGKMKTSFIKNLAKWGLTSTGEGVEEIASGLISQLGKQLTYGKDDSKSILENVSQATGDYFKNDAKNDFIGGAAVSMLGNSGNFVKSNYHGRDMMTGLTQNEQEVFDKEVDTRYNEELKKKGNEKLSKNQKVELKDKIENQVRNNLYKGKISANTVDEVVGQENVNLKGRKQDTNLVKSYINEANKSKKLEVQNTGNKELDYLYNKAANKEFTTKDGKKKYVNNTVESHENIQLLAKATKDLGIDGDFTTTDEIANNMKVSKEKQLGRKLTQEEIKVIEDTASNTNGYKQGNTLYLNIDSDNAGSFIIGHELKHFMEKDNTSNKELNKSLFNFAEEKGIYKSDLAERQETYKDIKDADIEGELAADYIGQFFTDEEFVNKLSTEKPKVFTQVYNAIKESFYNVTGQKDKALKSKIMNNFENAYRNYAQNYKGEVDTTIKAQNKANTETLDNNNVIIPTTTKTVDTKEIKQEKEQVNLPTIEKVETVKETKPINKTEQVNKVETKEINLPIAKEETKIDSQETKLPTNNEVLPTEKAIKTIEGKDNIKKKYDSANKIDGNKKSIVLSNGEKLSGTYKLVEAGTVTPSHNSETFEPTLGFPTTENGTTVNDRDYQSDKQAQALVNSKGSNYDGRAFNDNGVIVTSDGIVVSGNDRTMAGEIAARSNTDSEYINYLKENAGEYGFTKEQIDNMKHPRVVMELDGNVNYDTNTFAKFNKDSKKSKSVSEKAKEIGKTINADTVESISSVVDKFDSIDDLYNNEKATRQLLNLLQANGVIDTNQVSEVYNGSKFTGTGKDLVESVVLGSVISEDNVKYFSNNNDLKFKIMKTAPSIIQNKTLGDYSIIDNINQAIDVYKKASSSGKTLEQFTTQYNIFGDNNVDAITKKIAEIFENKGCKNLRNFIDKYNFMAEAPAKGQTDIFSSNGVQTKEDILKQALNINEDTDLDVLKFSISGTKARKTAKEYGKEKLAQILDKLGVNENNIYAITNYYKDNADNKIKTEINSPKFKDDVEFELNKKYRLCDLLNADDVFRAYPEFRDYNIIVKELEPNKRGSCDLDNNIISISNKLDQVQANSTLAHEVQHLIQSKEGFINGSAIDLFKEGFDEIGIELEKGEANYYYKMSGGELESRVVQRRLEMTKKQLANESPLETRRKILNEYAAKEKNQNLKNQYTEDNIFNPMEFADYVDKKSAKSKIVSDEYIDLIEQNNENVPLEKRVNGDNLLDAQDLIDEIKLVGANVDNNGYVTLYHVTTKENANKIKETGKMLGKEDGIFFSTSKEASQGEGRGGEILEFKIPAEKLVLDDLFSNNADVRIPLKSTKETLDIKKYIVDDGNYNNDIKYSISDKSLKEQQNEIIQNSNPVEDDYHTWIRSASDIKTFSETLQDSDYKEYYEAGDDFDETYTADMAAKALKTGKITVYSSYPIGQGVFVSPSRMEAESYSGNGKTYSKKVNLTDVAWIDPTQGQYAKVNDDIQYSISTKDNKGRELTKEQQEYFKDSKVVDNDGNLLTMYHGTKADFNSFIPSKGGEFGPGVYLADNEDTAKWYSKYVSKGENESKVMPVYVDMKNPYYIDKLDYIDKTANVTPKTFMNRLIKKGYDGIIGTESNGYSKQYIAFEPNQIKNVDNTNPTTNEDIRFSQGKGTNAIAPTLDYSGINNTTYTEENLPTNEESNLPTVEKTNTINNQSLPITDESKKTIESVLGTEKEYTSNKAAELYDEIKQLKKGTKASDELSSILDTGYDWKDIKTALTNIKWKPTEVVNENSGIESIAREMIARDYEEKASDLYFDIAGVENKENLTPRETAKLKKYNYAKSLEKLKNNLETVSSSIDNSISAKQNEYESKKNKDTKTAQRILQQINTLETRKSDIEVEYNNKIDKLSKKIKEYDIEAETQKITRKEVTAERRSQQRSLIQDITKIKDKKKGILYQINTMKRNLRDIMTPETAKNIYETDFKPIADNNAKIEKEITNYNDRISKFKLNDTESTYTQMWGELKWNPETTLTEKQVNDYYSKNKNSINKESCEGAAAELRTIYNELLPKINEVLVKNGYKAVDYRQGYFPHFIEEQATSPIGKLAEKLGWDIKKGTLPTDIAGLTDQFKPGKAWTSFSQQRTGDSTDYNALKGFDNYVRGAMDVIHHTEDIQKLRALENELRYQYSSDGIKEKIDNIYNDESLDIEEKNDAIASLTDDMKNNSLGNFVTEIRNYTNSLANKKSFSDRSMEQSFGRDTYSIMQNINSRVSANMVGANISSAMTNFIPITQAWSQVSTKNLMKGMAEATRNIIKDDGFTENSSYLINRTKQADRLYQSGLDKVNNKLSIPFEAIDSFTSNAIVRGKYYDNIEKGMSESEAISNANEFAKDVMGGRSKGDSPTIFNQKNPVMKLMTAFQLEVNNQYGYMFKDIPADLGGEAKDKLAAAFLKMFLGAYLYNMLSEKITGRKSAFSPIDMAIDDVKTASNENLDLGEKISQIATDTAQELPFVGGIMGGGRLPIQAAIPYSNPLDMVTSTISDASAVFDKDEAKKKTAITNLTKEWSKPLYYVALPFAGGQIKKTIEGLQMYNENLPVAGSYTNSGKLRFEADTSPLGKAQAAIFGQYASENARNYFNDGETPLTQKQIGIAMDSNLGINEFREYDSGIKNAKKIAKENKTSQTEAVYDYINNLPIADEQKNSLLNSELGYSDVITDKNGYTKYTDYNNKTYWYDEETDTLYNRNYHEVDNSKLNELTQYSNKKDISNYGDYSSLEEFNYSNNNPEKYSTIMQITDFNSYNNYKDDIEDISDEYEEEMDNAYSAAQKKAISNRKKKAIFNYINELDLNKYQKTMLYGLSGYSIKNYKSSLHSYIDNLDISKEEKETIWSSLYGD